MTLQKLVREIKSCGVGFDVWEIRNPTDNKGTGKYDFTSLFGNDKKKVLTLLPEKLSTVLHENTCTEVTKIWVDFRSIYNEINTWSHDKSADTFCLDRLQNCLAISFGHHSLNSRLFFFTTTVFLNLLT